VVDGAIAKGSIFREKAVSEHDGAWRLGRAMCVWNKDSQQTLSFVRIHWIAPAGLRVWNPFVGPK